MNVEMNVTFHGGGTFIFPNTFVDLPKTGRVWAKRGSFSRPGADGQVGNRSLPWRPGTLKNLKQVAKNGQYPILYAYNDWILAILDITCLYVFHMIFVIG